MRVWQSFVPIVFNTSLSFSLHPDADASDCSARQTITLRSTRLLVVLPEKRIVRHASFIATRRIALRI